MNVNENQIEWSVCVWREPAVILTIINFVFERRVGIKLELCATDQSIRTHLKLCDNIINSIVDMPTPSIIFCLESV